MMLADSIDTLAIDRAATEAHHKMFLGDGKEEYTTPPKVKTEDMNLGEITTVNHYHPSPPKNSGLVKTILGAGLIATGAALPVGSLLIADALKDQPTSQPTSQPDKQDTDTQYDLRLVD